MTLYPYIFIILVATAVTVAGNAQELRFERLNIEDGLVSSEITAMELDDEGFLWIGTVSGLSRYDGHEFHNYVARMDDPCALRDDYILDLCIGPDGGVFVVTRSGWSYLDRASQCFTFVALDSVLTLGYAEPIRSIHVDSYGTVWLGTVSGLVAYALPERKYTLYAIDDTEVADEVREVAPDMHHPARLIVGTTGALHSFEIEKRQFVMTWPPAASHWGAGPVSAIGPLTGSTQWVGFWGNGLGGFDVPAGEWAFYHSDFGQTFIDAQRGNVPWDVVYDMLVRDGNLWVGFSSGLGILPLSDGQMRMIVHDRDDPHSLSGTTVRAFARTTDEVVYVGTSDGLNVDSDPGSHIKRFDPYSVFSHTIDRRSGATSDLLHYCARVPLDDGHILYSDVVIGGVTFFDPYTNTYTHLDAGMTDNLPRWFADGISLDAQKVLLCTTDDLYVLDLESRTIAHFVEPLGDSLRKASILHPRVRRGSEGEIWVYGTNGLVVRDANGTIRSLPLQRSTFVSRLRLLVPYRERQAIVVAEYEAFVADMDQAVFRPLKMSGLLASTGRDGLLAGNELWIATGGSGVYRYRIDGNILTLVRRYTIDDGLPSNSVQCIAMSPRGDIWGSTNAGLFRLDTAHGYVRPYDRRDGVALPYIDEPAIFLEDGSVVFDDRRFLYHFDPAEVTVFHGKSYVDEIVTSDSTYKDLTHTVRMRPHENSLTFSVGVVDHINGHRDALFYKLEPFDSEWQQCGRDRTARYTNLPPGKYVFATRARNPDGIYSQAAEVPFSITPALNQRSWFAPLLILLALGGLYMVYRWRLTHVRKVEEQHTEFNRKVAELELQALRSQMNPHFMFNSLNSIKTYILKSEPDKAAEYLANFSHLIRMILQNAREKTVTLQEELDTLLLYIDLEKLRFRDGFAFHCSVDEGIDLSRINIPPMILQPYVENAIWHGLLHKEGERHLSLTFNRKNGHLTCTIKDNGIGRAKAREIRSKSATRYKSMGMGITHDRINLLNKIDSLGIDIEIVDIESDNGETGTVVNISLPYEGHHH